ncbi:hypothetical protein EYW49_14160 [Siculibacillus lacustris]|uniref:Uncharacterized protein n=1 Tax=Siculibacillus lacustris TaxID=1549641 RepID=A0A4Q9VLB2_9HYPH|nr:DUF6506 family protein [Siculibacillus lacustris]TBW36247.1 hypothetical protein EYW49_14160 [Siculibacillus lacustris]
MSIQAAFIFLAPEADARTHAALIETPIVHLHVVGVANYAAAVAAVTDLVAKGVVAIELCAGFGNQGVAEICRAAGDGIPVGVVRFDPHPALGFKSGDAIFAA